MLVDKVDLLLEQAERARFHLKDQLDRSATTIVIQVARARTAVLRGAPEEAVPFYEQVMASLAAAIGDVRGLGLLVGSEFTSADGKPDTATAQAAQQEAAKRGLLLLTCGVHGNVIRVLSPLVLTDAELDEALAAWEDALAFALG